MPPRQPCFDHLLQVLRREPAPRPVLFEFLLNERLVRRLLGRHFRTGNHARDAVLNTIGAFAAAGYDYAPFSGGHLFAFPRRARQQALTVSLNDGAVIASRADFAALPWPDIEQADFSLLDEAASALPPGMRLMVFTPDGVLENTVGLLGYDRLCLLLADDPGLVAAVCDRVGATLLAYYRRALTCPGVGLVMVNDDWGFKTQPMLAPADLRRYVFPWHRRFVAAAHAAGRPAVLHSCGQLDELMPEIIADLKFDGKHSYEDTICPVEEAYRRWGGRIAILGGLDVGFMARASPAEVSRRARQMLAAAPRGYALGTGNSVPAYVPDENYFAMTAAALETA